MAQPGNPYNPKDEGKHLSWDHGFSAMTEEECPYEKDDPDMADLRHAWSAGFRANKNRPKPRKPEPVQQPTIAIGESIPVQPVVDAHGKVICNVSDIPTDVLFAEVLKRMSEFESMFSKLKKVLG